VDSAVHKIAKRGIDQTLAFDTALTGEGSAFDRQAEMAFAGGVVAAVAAVLLAIVAELNAGWGKR